MDNEQRAWMGAKGVDPLRQGANARKAQTTGPEESLCRPVPVFRVLDLAFAKELGGCRVPKGISELKHQTWSPRHESHLEIGLESSFEAWSSS